MRKQKAGLFVALLCIVLPAQINAKDSNPKEAGEWELARKTNDISIYYRWVSNDTLETREMRATFEIEANTAQILLQFFEAENYYD